MSHGLLLSDTRVFPRDSFTARTGTVKYGILVVGESDGGDAVEDILRLAWLAVGSGEVFTYTKPRVSFARLALIDICGQYN